MIRPTSIVTFERCYLGAVALGLVNIALGWRGQIEAATINASRSGGAVSTGMVTNILVIGMAASTAISLLLWYFAARRAAVVAKWIIVVLFAIGALGALVGLARGGATIGLTGLGGVLTAIVWVLNIIAIWMLFRPDADAWFRKAPTATPDSLTDTFS